MILRKTKLALAPTALVLLVASQAAKAQPVRYEGVSRSGGRVHRADYIRAPLDRSAGYFFSGGDYYRPLCRERRAGHRETVCRTIRLGSRSVTRCQTRESERGERRCGDSGERDRRRRSCDRPRHDRAGISLGLWYDGKGRSPGHGDRQCYRDRDLRRGQPQGAEMRHRSQGRSHHASSHRRSSSHHSDRRGVHYRRSSQRRHR